MSFFNAKKHTTVGIIGGGISGLFYAYLCQKHQVTFTVFEKLARPGGCIDTFRHPTWPLYAETGAHTAYASYQKFSELAVELNLKQAVISKPPYRYQFLVDKKRSSFLKHLKYGELIRNIVPYLLLKNLTPLSTVKDKFSRIFGEHNWKNLFNPLLDGLLNQDSSNFPAQLVFKSRKTKAAFTPKKYSFEQGLSQMIDTLHHLMAHQILTDIDIKDVFYNQEKQFFSLKTERSLHTFDHLVLATPPAISASILHSIDPQISELLSRLSSTRSKAFVIESDLSPKEKRLAGCIAKNSPFRTVLHFYPFDKVVNSFLSVFHFIDPLVTDPLESIQLHYPFLKNPRVVGQKLHVMPVINCSTHQELQDGLKSITIPYALIGNYFGGVALEDCLLRAEQEFNRLTQKKQTIE